MIYIDLFSGIGGFALGAYWSGIRFDKHYFSEIDKDADELYSKRCPDAIPLGDITKVDWKALADTDRTRELQPEGVKQEERERIGDGNKTEYIITGGFPCQDLSVAGKGAGLEGERSGLWTSMFEAIRILRPRYVIIENVGAIVGWFPRIPTGQPPDNAIYMEDGSRRLDVEQYQAIEPVLNDLNSILYDAEGQNIRAEDMGAPHERKRIWIVAYPRDNTNRTDRGQEREKDSISEEYRETGCGRVFGGTSENSKDVADTNRAGSGTQGHGTNGNREKKDERRQGQSFNGIGRQGKELSNADGKYGNNARHGTSEICRERSEQAEVQGDITDTMCSRRKSEERPQGKPHSETKRMETIPEERSQPGEWLPEPDVGVLVDGLPAGLDRFEGRLSNKSYKKAAQIRGIGNSIVPQIAELLFRQIKELL